MYFDIKVYSPHEAQQLPRPRRVVLGPGPVRRLAPPCAGPRAVCRVSSGGSRVNWHFCPLASAWLLENSLHEL